MIRSFITHVAVAVVLGILGLLAWTAANLERAAADAREQMALLQYGDLDRVYDDVERSLGYLQRVPWVSALVTSAADLDEQRAAANYWRARYDALGPRRDANGVPVDDEPRVMTLAANAAYRLGQREAGDRQDVLHRLDAAVKSYGDLVKKNPGDSDAAYNYEYVIRFRDAVAKGRPVPPRRAADKVQGLALAGDLPAGRTIHGDPGAPPATVDLSKFKLVVPKREDERGPGDKAGDGKLKVRRG